MDLQVEDGPLDALGRDAVGLVEGLLLGAAAVGLVDGRLHRGGHRVRVEDHPALHVARRPTDRLDERHRGAQETLLVRVEHRDQGHLGNVEPFAQEVDSDQHIEGA